MDTEEIQVQHFKLSSTSLGIEIQYFKLSSVSLKNNFVKFQ